MKVLLDTNFLIDVIRFKINLDDIGIVAAAPYTLATVSTVLNELERISNHNSKSSSYAKLALQLIKKYNVEIIQVNKRADQAIFELVKNEKYISATNDKELRKRLKTLGMKTIYLKSKKHLAIG